MFTNSSELTAQLLDKKHRTTELTFFKVMSSLTAHNNLNGVGMA